MLFSVASIARFDTLSWDIVDHRYDLINLSSLNNLSQEETDTGKVRNFFKAIASVL